VNLIIVCYSLMGSAVIEVRDQSEPELERRLVYRATTRLLTWDGSELAGQIQTAIEGLTEAVDRLMM